MIFENWGRGCFRVLNVKKKISVYYLGKLFCKIKLGVSGRLGVPVLQFCFGRVD